jgi:UDPglucose 6-dehydrogenase
VNIGILGVGIVGGALKRYYEERGDTVFAWDKRDTGNDQALESVRKVAEVVFICVGTPYNRETGLLDCGNVFDAVESLGERGRTVVIKSTVMPGTTDALQERYPQHQFFFVPEFLSELTAYEDYANPRRPHVVGYTGQTPTDEAWRMVGPLLPGYDMPTVYIEAKQAELLKLATNSFYALKVAFANQMHDIGMTQEALDALARDPWIAESHFTVEHKSYRGFAGPCLAKDPRALVNYGHDKRVFGGVVAAACVYNDELLKRQGRSIDEWL